MGSSLIKEQLKTYKRKRDVHLFFLLIGVIATLIVFILLNLLKVNFNIIVTITLILVVALTVIIIYIKPRIITYSMYYKYYLMLDDGMNQRTPNRLPFTKSFIEVLNNNGYDSIANSKNFLVHYKIVDKLKEVRAKGKTLVAVVMAKTKNSDFYGAELQKLFENIHEKQKRNIRKQIVLQFQKYDTFNIETKEEIDKIINMVDGPNAVIHITCGMILDTQNIYFLRPNTKFPNRYYYYGVHTLETLLDID
ncbi:MAG: hypothetical protein WCZ19_00800 [Acholeplasma sp.]